MSLIKMNEKESFNGEKVKIEKKQSEAVKEFSRFAKTYSKYNIIQEKVANTLVNKLTVNAYDTIFDIGCGSGAVYRNILNRKITFKHYIALDSSRNMLSLHPNHRKIEKICADFNFTDVINDFELNENSILISSSALQWSKNLDSVFIQLALRTKKAYFSIFTSNTFKTLHETANITSPIYSAKVLKESIEKYYDAKFELKRYTLQFETVRDMFHYIKKSGVSGGERQLSFKQTKQLMCRYPLNYLEFEVLFVEGSSRM